MSTQQITGHEVEAEELGQALADPFELMTAGEVAAWLRVTKAWVYTQTRANRIPYVPLGRYVRYRRSAVLDWLNEIERESVAGTFRRA
jgi:excisionase family DNA binding protein